MLILLALACGPQLTPCEEAALYETEVVVARGELEPTPLVGGEVLSPVWGPQGGQHVWVGAFTSGLEPGEEALGRVVREGPTFSFTLEDDGGEAWGWGEHYGRPLPGDASAAELAGVTLALDYRFYWPEEDDEPPPSTFTLRVQAHDTCGVSAEARVEGLSIGD